MQENEPFLLSSILRCSEGMVPSITTTKRKDGTKIKYRYSVCSNFHNKGVAACKANSVKAYEAENFVLKKIECFLKEKEHFYNKIQAINSSTDDSLTELQQELMQVRIVFPRYKSFRINTVKPLNRTHFQLPFYNVVCKRLLMKILS
ncbi:zinc ribbon domain-containing protein [uncultured Metabacillus sp.]|uniref:zinc ribbon domain-containing protein n=1 Tax=uncultured Metabacillus sp. TaxID=2860135 RepID=UPI00345AFF6C